MSEHTSLLIKRRTGVLVEQLGVLKLKVTSRELSANEVLFRLILAGQQLADMKKAVVRDVFSGLGLTSLRDEDFREVINTIETIIERIRFEVSACPGLKSPFSHPREG